MGKTQEGGACEKPWKIGGNTWEGSREEAYVGPQYGKGTREGTAGHGRCDFRPLPSIWHPACTRDALETPVPTQEG